MAKAKAALAPLMSRHAQAEREKVSVPSRRSKSGDDEWTLTLPMKQALQDSALPKSDAVLAEIAKQEGIDQAPPELTASIWKTARELYRRQQEVLRLTERMKMEMEEITRLSENVLPEMMAEAQTKEMTSTTGVKLVKENKVYGNISEENKLAAHTWLETHKFGSIIKFAFSIPIEKGDTKLAKLVRAMLKKAKLAFRKSHPYTIRHCRRSFERALSKHVRCRPLSLTS